MTINQSLEVQMRDPWQHKKWRLIERRWQKTTRRGSLTWSKTSWRTRCCEADSQPSTRAAINYTGRKQWTVSLSRYHFIGTCLRVCGLTHLVSRLFLTSHSQILTWIHQQEKTLSPSSDIDGSWKSPNILSYTYGRPITKNEPANRHVIRLNISGFP